MKKIFFFFLVVLVQLTYSQQTESAGIEKQSSLGEIVSLQPITVTIGGNFIITGSFVASRFQRLDNFITTYYTQAQLNALRGLTKIEELKEVSKEIEKYAMRDITLKRATGETIKIDLLRYRLTGDFKLNPYLMNDDVIIFPSYDFEKTTVSINGAVNKPTKVQFVYGDKLSDAILFAGGLNSSYDNISHAEISRLDKTGNKEQLLVINIKDDCQLQSGDRIRILADENQKKDYKVLVLGQVKRPGFTYITKDGLTISEILTKAGGLTENADLRSAEVIRDYNSLDILRKYQLKENYIDNPDKLLQPETQIRLKQMKETLSMSRLATLTEEDTIFYNIDNQLRVLKSESLVDFTKINDPNSDESKFLVKEGDLILVPDKFEYIYVFGQVSKTGYVKYSEGKDYKYYIEKSGGLAETGREMDESVIIKGKQKNWITKDKEKIALEPGDYVYVPKEVPRSFWYTMSRIGTITGIIGAVVTTIFAITKF